MASGVAGAHARIVLPKASARKRFVAPSADVGDSLDVGPKDCDEAGNGLTRDGVHVSGVPDFLAFVAHGKPLNMHGCWEAARRSLVRVTVLSGLLKQQGATVPHIVHTFCADSQDKLVLFAFCLANMALKRKKSHGEVSATRAAEPDFVEAKKRELDKHCNVNKLVPDRAQTVVTTRSVITEKVLDDGTVTPKSRFVARGFQEADKDAGACAHQSKAKSGRLREITGVKGMGA